MKMPLSDILDRYSILILKQRRLPQHEDINKACIQFKMEIDIHEDQDFVQEHLEALIAVNGKIWDLESDIRRGKEGELGLEEVGRRALMIRDLNTERVRLKNLAAERLGEFKEVKVDHASSTS